MIGLREIVLIGMVVVALYGRSGVLKSRSAQTIMPWISPRRRAAGDRRGGTASTASQTAERAGRRPRSRIPGASLVGGDRLLLFFTILTATAIAAWIVTRTWIASRQSGLPLP